MTIAAEVIALFVRCSTHAPLPFQAPRLTSGTDQRAPKAALSASKATGVKLGRPEAERSAAPGHRVQQGECRSTAANATYAT